MGLVLLVLGPKFSPLRYAKAMLFIDDGQAQVFELDDLFQECMRSDQEGQFSGFQGFMQDLSSGFFGRTGSKAIWRPMASAYPRNPS
jgi:hypothetical protein